MGTLETITGKKWGIIFDGKKCILYDWSGKKGLPEWNGTGLSWDEMDIIYSGNPKHIKSVLEEYERLNSPPTEACVFGQKPQEWYNKKEDSEGLIYFFEKENYGKIEIIVCS